MEDKKLLKQNPEHSGLNTTTMIYKTISEDGIEELQRPTKALIFSGVSAGLFISFSFFFTAALKAYLPADEPWTHIISSMGYTVGFVIVILGHMQLFTENTISTVIPLLSPFTFGKLGKVARLWTIVFLSNIVGTTIAAWFLTNDLLLTTDLVQGLASVSEHVASQTALQNIIKAIPAGILISVLVWLLPGAKHWLGIVFFITYLMALGGFAHVIVGSGEMAYSVFMGHSSVSDYFLVFLLPTAFGNIIGGTGIFTLLMFGQVASDNSKS